jgi:transposase
MGKPYSLDLRERVIAEVEAYGNVRRVGEKFSVSPSFVVKLSQAKRSGGGIEPKPQGGDHRSDRIEAHRDWLLDLVRETVDLTLSELRDRLAERGLSVSISTIWRFYERHDIGFKKNRARQRARAGRRQGGAGDVAAKPTQP